MVSRSTGGVGEFMLSHPNLRCPERGTTYTANTGRYEQWEEPVRRFIDHLNTHDPATGHPYKLRYGGAPVADVHRCLTEGGVSMYPPIPTTRTASCACSTRPHRWR